MKRVIVILLAALLLAGCAASGPEGTVTAFCEAVQKTDYAAMSALTGNAAAGADLDLSEQFGDDFDGYLKELNGQMQFTVGTPAVQGNEAAVPVHFVYRDCGPVIQLALQKYLQMALTQAYSTGDADFAAILAQAMQESMTEAEPGERTADVQLLCVKQDGKWVIADVPDELMDVLTAGLYGALNALSQTMDG